MRHKREEDIGIDEGADAVSLAAEFLLGLAQQLAGQALVLRNDLDEPVLFVAVNLDLHDLIVFRADLANFRKAAEAVHISQPAFSRRIDKLEQALGCGCSTARAARDAGRRGPRLSA